MLRKFNLIELINGMVLYLRADAVGGISTFDVFYEAYPALEEDLETYKNSLWQTLDAAVEVADISTFARSAAAVSPIVDVRVSTMLFEKARALYAKVDLDQSIVKVLLDVMQAIAANPTQILRSTIVNINSMMVIQF